MNIIRVKRNRKVTYYEQITRFCDDNGFNRQTIYNKLSKVKKCEYRGFTIERVQVKKVLYDLGKGIFVNKLSVL